ncbi:unnamed protein product [Bemisia tabaci]|uniref:Alpha-1,3-glucosyltransferase n=1 Tax=Bemisia tabaci TaxID=7038 RepID=A0A9P0AFN4_BEMTA|nr:unnamed protein product [Bemisia tabaci]
MILVIFLTVTCFKLLLMPSYLSTDFEVHRNWLAITHSLPLKEWYHANHSEWTLDYPPLFAWFEYGLSQGAKHFDEQMLNVTNLNYKSEATVVYQRLTVIFMDIVLAIGVKEIGSYLNSNRLKKSSKWGSQWCSPVAVLNFLMLINAGLLFVDHVHFQYNGFLFGILLVSITRILQGRIPEGAFWFAVLLNLKHIFMYIAPTYFIYLLRNYCISGKSLQLSRLMCLGIIVIAVFSVSFGPFILLGQLSQVLSRLFPFKRGLCHAYWAPNFWALYNLADKILYFAGRKLNLLDSTASPSASMTGGLVQEYSHAVLPNVSPVITFILTVLASFPNLMKLWVSPGNPLHFVRSLILCAFTSFMFGWHVHEKAILMVIVPMTLMSIVWKKEASLFLLTSTVGYYSLLPLLFEPFELPIKVIILVTNLIYSYANLSQLFHMQRSVLCLPLLTKLESIYIFGLVPLFLYESVFHPILKLDQSYPFLPLLLTSVYCSLGLMYCWINYYRHFLLIQKVNYKKKAH